MNPPASPGKQWIVRGAWNGSSVPRRRLSWSCPLEGSSGLERIAERVVTDWEALMEARAGFDEAWLFRGQPSAWPLVTTLERACALFDVPPTAMPAVEDQMIREFRRRYAGRHRGLTLSDTLFCMALMQHHGAPTRLLDFTYSFYVAAYFALEPFGDAPTIWCLNGRWSRARAAAIAGEAPIAERERRRDETSFRALFMNRSRRRFVLPENPFPLHRRLIIQQGVFVCPADVSASFLENLDPGEAEASDALVKLRLEFEPGAWRGALTEFSHMNIDRASLFPGLDGFAQSLQLRIPLYQRIAAAWAEADADRPHPVAAASDEGGSPAPPAG